MSGNLFAALDALIKEIDQRAQEQEIKTKSSGTGENLLKQSRESLEKKAGEREAKYATSVHKEEHLKQALEAERKQEVSGKRHGPSVEEERKLAQRQEMDAKRLKQMQESTSKALAREQEQKRLGGPGQPAQQQEAVLKRIEHGREQESKLRERAEEHRLKLEFQKEHQAKYSEQMSKVPNPEVRTKVPIQTEQLQKLRQQRAELEQKRIQQAMQEDLNKKKLMQEMSQKMAERSLKLQSSRGVG